MGLIEDMRHRSSIRVAGNTPTKQIREINIYNIVLALMNLPKRGGTGFL